MTIITETARFACFITSTATISSVIGIQADRLVSAVRRRLKMPEDVN